MQRYESWITALQSYHPACVFLFKGKFIVRAHMEVGWIYKTIVSEYMVAKPVGDRKLVSYITALWI